MSIKDFTEKIKPLMNRLKEGIELKNDLFIIALIFFTGIASYGLGKLSALENNKEIKPISSDFVPINNTEQSEIMTATLPNRIIAPKTNNLSGPVYASKTGKRYYYSWCTGLNRIKEENKVTFPSKIEAETAGLTLASGCN